jgi:hypothetical protein
MRSRCCLRVYVSPPQAGIVKPEETAVKRQRLRKKIPAATNTQATLE